jgi:hypothetical protein
VLPCGPKASTEPVNDRPDRDIELEKKRPSSNSRNIQLELEALLSYGFSKTYHNQQQGGNTVMTRRIAGGVAVVTGSRIGRSGAQVLAGQGAKVIVSGSGSPVLITRGITDPDRLPNPSNNGDEATAPRYAGHETARVR